MRELTLAEVEQVGGAGISSTDAGRVLTGFGAAIFTGAVIGGIAAGPAGFVGGAVLGASRAAFSYGVAALIGGAYALAC